MRTEHVAVWLVRWRDGDDTGFHDHDLAAGAVAVVEGQVLEERLTLDGPTVARVAGAGDAFTVSVADIHRVSHVSGEPAVTIHAYSPPVRRMGATRSGRRSRRPGSRCDQRDASEGEPRGRAVGHGRLVEPADAVDRFAQQERWCADLAWAQLLAPR